MDRSRKFRCRDGLSISLVQAQYFKMFTTVPLLANHFSYHNYHTPPIPSPLSSQGPLSPCNGNSHNPTCRFMTQISSPKNLKSRLETPYSKRVTKENPLIHSRGDGRETRRSLFLKKVREGSEEKR